MSIDKINFLVVDDMESMRGIIKANLKNLGAEHIEMASNGYEGIKVLSSKKIDLVISDWDMPKVTGLQFLQFVRQSDDFKKLPFLLLTASNDRERVKSAIELGVSDYLSKPFQPQMLFDKLNRIIKKHGL